ncbi:cytochrome c and c1 heme-lyase [Dichomitus squalens]|uniref:Holocytochrome c-type synthase n=1 Tax=Dichomitus squalens TaxID=114155 RepID=A0A4Q9Q2Y0_9APHY|nr:cytochrome c and c1 heme-lyase [Dichomitus squalens]TBU60934.1 cytochrome c and c1 heme-lyase [Dichomitus squalens]
MGQAASQSVVSSPAPPAQCPIDHSAVKAAPAKCPISHDKPATSPSGPPQSSLKPAECPIKHDSDGLNPLNQMPTLSQMPAEQQLAALPTQRETSTIPRDDGSRWEYPSPQQFYNALVRKGWETPEEHVETMVQIHNFLNEQAWQEILKWERKENPVAVEQPQLARFKGRPGELSPKARFWLFAGWLLPSRFNTEPPFDRHDWIVRRPGGEEVRYVIDYYSAPPEPDGSPVFSLDVRPALDSVGSIKQRIQAATEDVWAAFREENARNSSQNAQR